MAHHQSLKKVYAIVTPLIIQLEDCWCHLSYNLTISGATTYDWNKLVTTETDWLHNLTFGVVAPVLHLVVQLIADSPHRWHDYPLQVVRSTKFMSSCNHVYHQTYGCLRSSTSYCKQLQYAITIENRGDWSHFDLLSLVVWFQNRAIPCDWGWNGRIDCQVQFAKNSHINIGSPMVCDLILFLTNEFCVFYPRALARG
jgi:hypothetical protein